VPLTVTVSPSIVTPSAGLVIARVGAFTNTVTGAEVATAPTLSVAFAVNA
jgi:hypothetical protein